LTEIKEATLPNTIVCNFRAKNKKNKKIDNEDNKYYNNDIKKAQTNIKEQK